MVVGGSSSRWVCAPVTAVAVGRVGYHAHREEEPPPVDHSHGRRRQAAAASLEACYRRAGIASTEQSAVLAAARRWLLQCGVAVALDLVPLKVRTSGPTCRLAFHQLGSAGFPRKLADAQLAAGHQLVRGRPRMHPAAHRPIHTAARLAVCRHVLPAASADRPTSARQLRLAMQRARAAAEHHRAVHLARWCRL